jgi:hypothetical protein
MGPIHHGNHYIWPVYWVGDGMSPWPPFVPLAPLPPSPAGASGTAVEEKDHEPDRAWFVGSADQIAERGGANGLFLDHVLDGIVRTVEDDTLMPVFEESAHHVGPSGPARSYQVALLIFPS